jgi:nitroreductase
MELSNVFMLRRSCREFSSVKYLTEAQLDCIKYAIERSPSAGGLRAFEVVSTISQETKRQLALAACNQMFIRDASAVFVFFANPGKSARKYGERGTTLYSIQDATIACTHAYLAATNMGLESCWIGAFNDTEVCSVTGADIARLQPIAILPIGYRSQ